MQRRQPLLVLYCLFLFCCFVIAIDWLYLVLIFRFVGVALVCCVVLCNLSVLFVASLYPVLFLAVRSHGTYGFVFQIL